MPLIRPIKEGSFGRLVLNFFVSPLITKKLQADSKYEMLASSDRPEKILGSDYHKTPRDKIKHRISNLFKGAVLQALPYDGFDPVTNTFTTASGRKRPYTSEKLSLSVVILTILGIANRPDHVVEAPKYLPSLSLKQAFKDWIGGWTPLYSVEEIEARSVLVQKVDSDDSASHSSSNSPLQIRSNKIRVWNLNAKTILQIPALLFKFLIILPIKIFTWPFKVILNVAKIFTEVLPLFISDLAAYGMGNLLSQISNKWHQPIAKRNLSKESLPNNGKSKKGLTRASKVGFILTRSILLVLLGIVHYTTRAVFLVLRAITSPEISARRAFYTGLGLRIRTGSGESLQEWRRLSKVLGFILGSVSALVSLAASATLWALTLPLLIGGVTTLIPEIVPLFAWLANLPVISSVLTTLTATFSSLGILVTNTFAAAFAPAITAMASLIPGLVVGSEAIAIGVFFGLMLAPVASVLSRISDTFSNLWAAWNPPKNTLQVAVSQEVGITIKSCASGEKNEASERYQSFVSRDITDSSSAQDSGVKLDKWREGQHGVSLNPTGSSAQSEQQFDNGQVHSSGSLMKGVTANE